MRWDACRASWMRGSGSPRVLLVLALGIVLVLVGTLYYLSVPASGTLVIQVRDAPTDFSHLLVTFSEVRVHPANAGNESQWLNLSLAVSTIDFMNLGNLTKVLALNKVPAGKYTQIRIVVTSASGTMMGGASVPMTVAGGILETNTPFDLKAGGVTTVTLDFDLAQSIHQASGSWVFMPVLGSVVVS